MNKIALNKTLEEKEEEKTDNSEHIKKLTLRLRKVSLQSKEASI